MTHPNVHNFPFFGWARFTEAGYFAVGKRGA